MNEILSPRRQQAELAFAKICQGPSLQTRAQTEHELFAAERQARTAHLRELRIAKDFSNAKSRSA